MSVAGSDHRFPARSEPPAPRDSRFVTHLLPIVLNLASTIMLMNAGAILQGAVDDVLQENRLTELYGVRCALACWPVNELVVERGRSSHV